MKRKILALAVVCLALAGCSAIDEGYITEKNHKPAYSTTTLSCAVYGKYGCISYVPVTNYYPESWWFSLIEQHDGIGDNEEQKTGWVYVGPDTFESYEVGEYYEPVKAKS